MGLSDGPSAEGHGAEGATAMLFQSNYSIVGDRTVESGKALMAAFGQRGKSPGEIAHYVRADGTGGTVISENSDAKELHEVALAYAQWLEIEIIPILTIDDAVPALLTYFG
jgi:hypothetical protein